MSGKIINKNIIEENIIDREELIEYLTWILENDGELEKFYDREDEDDPVPDVLGFRDWLKEQTFDNMISESYFEEYIMNVYESIGQYDPECFIHKFLDWEEICERLKNRDYHKLYGYHDDHPYDIFGEEFFYHS